MDTNRRDLYNYLVKDLGYTNTYEYFLSKNFSSLNSAKTFYEALVENVYNEKTPDNVPSWEYWAGLFCCDLRWASSESYCKEAKRIELLKQFPECVKTLGELMRSERTNKLFINVTSGTYSGFFFYPDGTFLNGKTYKKGTYECDENGEIKLNYNFNIEKQSKPQQQQKQPQQNGTEYTRCEGFYHMGCYNPDAISKVQTYLGLKPTGYFDQSTQNKLEGLGYNRGFKDSEIPRILELTGYGKIDTSVGEINETDDMGNNQPQQNKIPDTDLPYITYMKHSNDFFKDPLEPQKRLRYKGPRLSPNDLKLIDDYLRTKFKYVRVKQKPKDKGFRHVWSRI